MSKVVINLWLEDTPAAQNKVAEQLSRYERICTNVEVNVSYLRREGSKSKPIPSDGSDHQGIQL